jgi:drug/metabolite transporter (DMT)-like permease
MTCVGIVYGLLTSLSIGAADFFGRRVANARGPVVTGVSMQFVAIFASIVSLAIVPSSFSVGALAIGAVSGFGLGVGLWGYFGGLQRSSSAVVAPLVATLSAVVPYLYAIVRGSTPAPLAVGGAAVAIVGLVLITLGGGRVAHLRSGLLWGLVSGLGYGIGLSVVIEASDASGSWPAVGQRLAACSLMLAAAARLRVDPRPPAGLRLVALAAGSVAGLSTIFYLLGVEVDATSTVVTASLFPAVSVIVGRVVYADDVGRRQVVGLIVVLAGVILLAVS